MVGAHDPFGEEVRALRRALHKICKKHDIPNPALGWWAKKAAGKAVKQIPLPKAKTGGQSGCCQFHVMIDI